MKSPKSAQRPSELELTLKDISIGVPRVSDKTAPDARDVMEESRLDDQERQEKIEDIRSDRALRKKYADRILGFLELYALAVFILLIADGANANGFDIPENAIIALVGSTAIAAIGLVGFIAKGLFK